MRTHLLIAAALALAATVTSANALTVVNSDKTSHVVMVTPEGGKAQKAHYDAKIQKIQIKAGKFVAA